MLLRHIHYFLAVADHGGFTRAAAALHVSQPALSQQIRQLEETLGTPLFDRSGRTTRLTDAGEVYQRYARRALLDLDAGKRALHDVQDLSRGTLRLGVTPTFTAYLVGPLMEAFHGRYPGIALTVREMPQEQMEELLNDDQLDAGIAFDPVRSSDIATQPLLTETLALVVGKNHPCAGKRTMGLHALNDESLVLLSSEFATREQIDRYCRQHGVRPHVAIEANSISAVVEIVRRTALSTLLPAAIAEQNAELSAISLSPSLLERTAALLHRKDAYQSAALRAFIELALEDRHRGKRRRK
ncbi:MULTISPECIES: transcriptional regulator CynR [unclassified Dyella]|uniref:transcriptional regulator CynR n=1 Tax=unclassified Dyella TaxID=2634549 RepID=UPI000C85DC65|nr:MULTISPECIES: transcriptional regulator CynR [unclassified Dyella]MDR3443652.1 transcriptional regulator CynR [Dyella sp.]PMQ03745.1 HTH-type transcriptional regulator CynR [Dyella sp. AD56]